MALRKLILRTILRHPVMNDIRDNKTFAREKSVHSQDKIFPTIQTLSRRNFTVVDTFWLSETGARNSK